MGNSISRHQGSFTYKERKERIRGSMQNMAGEYIEIGYHLRAVQAGEEYREDGYKSIYEFALEEFGMAKPTVNHCMRVNAEFSEGGNSPKIAGEYRGFSKSQLQEMLYIPMELRDDVKPDMSVKKIRGIKNKRLDIEPEQQEEPQDKKPAGHYSRGCITGWSRYPKFCSCCGHGGAECCSQCDEDCNSRCGWVDNPYVPEDDIPSQMHVEDYPDLLPESESCAAPHMEEIREIPKEEPDVPGTEILPDEPVADAEYREADRGQKAEKYEELSSLSDLDLLKEKLRKEQRTLALMREEFTEKDKRVRLQKLVVGALAANICDLDNILDPPPKPVQPELPVLKNNEQRKAWLSDYKDWGLWYEDEHIGCKYYKYDFENGARLIAETYLVPKSKYTDGYEACYLHLVGGPNPPQAGNGCCGKWQRHERYNRYPSSETELVEFLKYVQK